ncbi:MAG TPA: transposase [Verrucomicrobiae bacterium]|nr:transposase [Verrucomicrobiae bacterium]
MVNVKIKKILAMIKVTDEHYHDSKALPVFVKDSIKSDNMVSIGKLFGDAAYDSNNIFNFLADNGIQPCIKVRKNSRVGWKKGNTFRNLTVLAQKSDLQRWKDSIVIYGRRWIVETVFSCLKQSFGECIHSVKFENMVKEMMLKASLYNKLISV